MGKLWFYSYLQKLSIVAAYTTVSWSIIVFAEFEAFLGPYQMLGNLKIN